MSDEQRLIIKLEKNQQIEVDWHLPQQKFLNVEFLIIGYLFPFFFLSLWNHIYINMREREREREREIGLPIKKKKPQHFTCDALNSDILPGFW